jgi:ectoine hydroxylase-related dioxygenase (phytanoyl-CoA dioxygenase family)
MIETIDKISASHTSNRDKWLADGFLIHGQSIVPDKLLKNGLQGVEAVLAGIYDRGTPRAMIDVGQADKIQRITQIHHANNALFELFSLPRIGELVHEITGAKFVQVWGTQLYYKPAGSELTGQVGFHCDSQHLNFLEGEFLTAWMPLTDITMESGPLLYVNGSHQWLGGFKSSGGEKQDLDEQRRLMQAQYPERQWKETPVIMNAGGISFHHKNTYHGSAVNYSDSARIAICFGILTDRAKLIAGESDCGVGEIIDKPEFCPVIYNEY